MNVLWDLRIAGFSALSSDHVRGVMDFVSQNWGKEDGSKAALGVTNVLDYGMSRIHQIMQEGAASSSVGVFKDMNKAKEWIEAE